MSRSAVFLDRDGTINVEKHFLHRIQDWEWTPSAIEAIRTFNRRGFQVIVVSNQAGIARGLFTTSAVHKLHYGINTLLAQQGARIDDFYFCPHHPDFGSKRRCFCRKPSPGLIYKAQKEHGLDLSRSYLIGDKAIDVQMGQTAGVQPILVLTGYGRKEKTKISHCVPVVKNLYYAMKWVLMDFKRHPRLNPSRRKK